MSRRDNEANQPYREEWLADSDDDGTDPVPMGIVVDRACRLYVRNIPQSEIDRDAHAAMRKDFEAYGAVDRYTLFVDKSGRYTGSAMVTYKEAGSAKNAMRGLNKRVNDDGSILAVEQARDDGAIPMSQLTERVRRDDEKQWSHDLFDEMQQPAPRGGRGGRRGRGMGGRGGGYGGRGGGGDNDDVMPPRQRGAQNSALTTEELDDMMAKYRAQKS